MLFTLLKRLVRSLEVSALSRLVVTSAQRLSAFWASASSFLRLFTVWIASAYWVMAFSIAFGRLVSRIFSRFCSRGSTVVVFSSGFVLSSARRIHDCFIAVVVSLFSCWAFVRSCLVPSHGRIPLSVLSRVECVGWSVSLSSSSIVCWIVWLRM